MYRKHSPSERDRFEVLKEVRKSNRELQETVLGISYNLNLQIAAIDALLEGGGPAPLKPKPRAIKRKLRSTV